MNLLAPLTVPLGDNVPPLVLDAPWLLVLAVMLPWAVWWLRRQRRVQRTQRLARFAEPEALQRLVPQAAGDRRRTWRLVLAAVCIGLAMAG
ncbi:MAG: hypothetical protein ACK55A_14490, partial [Gemmatimonas sp.]